MADGILHSEVNRITREVLAVPGFEAPTGGSIASETVADAVGELLACFPVYRSYLPAGRAHLDEAFALARRHRPDLAATFDALAPVLSDPAAEPALRFQQTSGMVMAKGVEDCAFYRYSRLTSLNEVGGDPVGLRGRRPPSSTAGPPIGSTSGPQAMTSLSTHDTKRGEDVRARITVLAELPDVWERALDELLALAPVPDPGVRRPAVAGDRRRLAGTAPRSARQAARLRREGDARGR